MDTHPYDFRIINMEFLFFNRTRPIVILYNSHYNNLSCILKLNDNYFRFQFETHSCQAVPSIELVSKNISPIEFTPICSGRLI